MAKAAKSAKSRDTVRSHHIEGLGIVVIYDGPYRYLYSAKTGALLTTLCRVSGGFVKTEGEGEPGARSLTDWKAIIALRRNTQTAIQEH
jgi:hypothetical protein